MWGLDFTNASVYSKRLQQALSSVRQVRDGDSGLSASVVAVKIARRPGGRRAAEFDGAARVLPVACGWRKAETPQGEPGTENGYPEVTTPRSGSPAHETRADSG